MRLLELAGLRLAVLDEDGREVEPFPADAVRDNADRRFPAHLDVVPPDHRPGNRGAGPRYDRPPAQAWYARRVERDSDERDGGERPQDHPTAKDIEEHLSQERERLTALARSRVTPKPEPPPCTCSVDCYEHPGCLPECRCQCEPPQPRFGQLTRR